MDDLDANNYSEDKNFKNMDFFITDYSKQNNYIKTHTSFDEKTINENNFDISNYNYEMKNKNNINNENEEYQEDENDISSEDEYDYHLKTVKIGILKVKLNILNKIIISKIQKYYYCFVSKVNLKIKSNEIFLQDDNFLYSKLKLKTSEANKFYALKKLIYVVRKNSYEKLLKQNYFYHWKIIKEDKYLFNKNKESYLINSVKLCSLLVNIFNKNYDYKYFLKYFISKWKFSIEEKEIYKNKISKGMIILSSLFNRKIRKIFKIFPRNFLNLQQKSKIFKALNNNQQITYIIEDNEKLYQKGLDDFYKYKKKYINLLKQNKLLKIIEKLDAKNKVNKTAFKFFHLLKNSSKMSKYKKQIKNLNNSMKDLKYDSMLNAAIIIKIILDEHIHNDLFKNKQLFLEELNIIYKFNSIKYQYNNHENFINDEEKTEIQNMRLKYQKIFALQKILIINNQHKLYYNDLNIQLKFSLLWKYFKIWKKYSFDFSIKELKKKLSTQKIFLLLNNIHFYKIIKNTFFIIKKKSIQNSFKKKKYYFFSFFIYLLLKKHLSLIISKDSFYFFKQLLIQQQDSKFNNKRTNYLYKKLFFIYKKFISIKKFRYLIKWFFISCNLNRNIKIFQEKIKSILININNFKNIQKKSQLFNTWKEQIKEKKSEEEKSQTKKNFYLYKLLTMKHIMTLWFYLKKWSSITIKLNNGLNYDNLVVELEKVRKENDNLIAIYYKKRQEYAKTLYDYNYMKKFYCENCINEKEDEIDYMSLKSNDIKEAGKADNSLIVSQNIIDISKDNYKNFKKSLEETIPKEISGIPASFDENNFVVNEENRLQTNNSNMNLSEDNDISSNYVGKKVEQLNGEILHSKNATEDDNFNNIFNNINDNENVINSDNIGDYKREYEEQKKYYENYINILLEKKNELMEMKQMIINQRLNTSKSE